MPRSAAIALFLPRLSRYGGAEGFALRLAEALVRSGHRVEYVCARQESPAPEGVRVRVIGRKGVSRAGKLLHFAWQAERLRPDYALSIGLGKTLRQDLLRVGGGPLCAFWRLSDRAWTAGAPRLWKQLRRRLAPANLLTLALERRQLSQARSIVAVSQAVADWLVQCHPQVPRHKIRVIYNEPDPLRYHPAPPVPSPLRRVLGLDDSVPCIGTAGSNFRLKGLEPLIRALALLPHQCRLLVAGGRNPGRYAALARELGVGQRVHFLGKVNDMPGFYRSLQVFALPSFYDACANAVLEAVACGIPTVSSTANGSSVILPANQVVQEPDDIPTLAAALQQALQAPHPVQLQWPEQTLRGLGPYLQLVDELLARR